MLRNKIKPRSPTVRKYQRVQKALPEKEFLAELLRIRLSCPLVITPDRPSAWLTLFSYFFVVIVQFFALYELGCFFYSDNRSPWLFSGIVGCLFVLFLCIVPIKENIEFLQKPTGQ
jgi:hypothetical protein